MHFFDENNKRYYLPDNFFSNVYDRRFKNGSKWTKHTSYFYNGFDLNWLIKFQLRFGRCSQISKLYQLKEMGVFKCRFSKSVTIFLLSNPFTPTTFLSIRSDERCSQLILNITIYQTSCSCKVSSSFINSFVRSYGDKRWFFFCVFNLAFFSVYTCKNGLSVGHCMGGRLLFGFRSDDAGGGYGGDVASYGGYGFGNRLFSGGGDEGYGGSGFGKRCF